MKEIDILNIYIKEKRVGRLAVTKEYLTAFEYDSDWLKNGFAISPLSLPLEKRVFISKRYETFDGLFGVFADSLPDGWGRLLVDRMLLGNGINPEQISTLQRLSIVGRSGMGALEYVPETKYESPASSMSLDEIAKECEKIFELKHSDDLDKIFYMGGSSGGARPKVFYSINEEEWIVKFPSSIDCKNIGELEYKYAICAKKCNIEVPEVKLLPSKVNSGYFACKRFDRKGKEKVHMISASALLETSHRIPNLDYNILMQLTLHLTQDYEEVEKLYRLMCFNVFAHNRDDHSKNFSFLYDEGKWSLSPAYDLTYSNSIGGEHATTVAGNGLNPGMEELLSVAKQIGINEKWAKNTAQEIRETVNNELKIYTQQTI